MVTCEFWTEIEKLANYISPQGQTGVTVNLEAVFRLFEELVISSVESEMNIFLSDTGIPGIG